MGAGTRMRRIPVSWRERCSSVFPRRHVGSGLGVAGGGWLQVSSPYAVLQNLDVSGGIDVAATAKNTSISNVRVTADGYYGILVRYDYNAGTGATGVTITDADIHESTFDSPGLGVGISAQNGVAVTIRRVDIVAANGVQLDRGVLTDSYIHDVHVIPTGTHVNGFTSNAGSGPCGLPVRHNTILNPIDQTDAVSLFQDFGVQRTSPSTTTCSPAAATPSTAAKAARAPTKNIRITNNRISNHLLPQWRFLGWLAHFTPPTPATSPAATSGTATGKRSRHKRSLVSAVRRTCVAPPNRARVALVGRYACRERRTRFPSTARRAGRSCCPRARSEQPWRERRHRVATSSPESSASVEMALASSVANCSGSVGWTRIPHVSSTTLPGPPRSLTISGRPKPIASKATLPPGSR